MSPLMAQSGHIEASVRLSAFGAKRTCALVWLRRPRPLMTGTVEKGFWGRSLSNIDSRSNATAQSRFKNPFVRIRLFQILIPQLHFGDFFNSIGQLRSSEDVRCTTALAPKAEVHPRCPMSHKCQKQTHALQQIASYSGATKSPATSI